MASISSFKDQLDALENPQAQQHTETDAIIKTVCKHIQEQLKNRLQQYATIHQLQQVHPQQQR